MSKPVNDAARMSQLWHERAYGFEHEWKMPDGSWQDVPEEEDLYINCTYRAKPKELTVWIGNCSEDGVMVSLDKLYEDDEADSGLLNYAHNECEQHFDIPVGEQRQYKLVPVEVGE
jgi:hypothetical protein